MQRCDGLEAEEQDHNRKRKMASDLVMKNRSGSTTESREEGEQTGLGVGEAIFRKQMMRT